MGVLEMDSRQSKLLKDSKVSPSDGPQPSSDTPLKVSESSVSMKSSRMSTEVPPERANQNTELLVSPFHLLAPNSSLIVSSAQWKPLRSRCKRLKKVLSQPVPSKVLIKLTQLKV